MGSTGSGLGSGSTLGGGFSSSTMERRPYENNHYSVMDMVQFSSFSLDLPVWDESAQTSRVSHGFGGGGVDSDKTT